MESEGSTFEGRDLHLDLDGPAGRRSSLEEALREAIRSGRLPADSRLPSTRALAADLGLARERSPTPMTNWRPKGGWWPGRAPAPG